MICGNKIGDLNKKVEWFDLHFETSHLDLLSFKETLSKKRSMNDYSSDTQFINNLIDSVQNVSDKFPKIKEEFELNRQFINELNKHKHDFSEDSDINLLNDNTMRINRTIINVDEWLEKLKDAGSQVKNLRVEFGNVFVQRNIELKSDKLGK